MESSWIPGSYRPIVLICIGLWGWGLNLLLLYRHNIDPSYLLQIQSSSSNDKRVYQPIFFLATILTVIVLFNLWVYLNFVQFEDASWLPLLAYLSSLVLLLWPGKEFYRKERTRFIRLVRRIGSFNLFANVYFADIIFADLLTSFSNVLGDMFLTGCIILPGKSNQAYMALESDTQNAYYRDIMVPLIISLPYFIRLRQCISEYIESRGETRRHLFNALKYASAFPVIILSAVQKKASIYITETGSIPTTWWIDESNLFRLWMIAVFVNSLYSFWWDISMDWNLIQVTYEMPTTKHAEDHHPYHGQHHLQQHLTPMVRFRRNLHFSMTPVYFLAMMADFILRITWSLKLSSHVYIKRIEGSVFLVELLEVVRRWIWVIFRMESEWIKRANLPTTSSSTTTAISSTTTSPTLSHNISPSQQLSSLINGDIRMNLLDRPKHTLLTPIHEEEDPLSH
ncbi:EXS family-domain-containing protein [Halteromyces radiatus]|uniref:EXS family-domain-containing protein n=1 Tax=Halteromyces radiatus TaxID=101107 RepID=UPI00222070FC|nr:EXS family-domain-containing protein [Halteromyces radiatus]KAI8098897.1 EXS family-domain-containing protein [Halteromyces radiatus]